MSFSKIIDYDLYPQRMTSIPLYDRSLCTAYCFYSRSVPGASSEGHGIFQRSLFSAVYSIHVAFLSLIRILYTGGGRHLERGEINHSQRVVVGMSFFRLPFPFSVSGLRRIKATKHW